MRVRKAIACVILLCTFTGCTNTKDSSQVASISKSLTISQESEVNSAPTVIQGDKEQIEQHEQRIETLQDNINVVKKVVESIDGLISDLEESLIQESITQSQGERERLENVIAGWKEELENQKSNLQMLEEELKELQTK